MTHLDLFAGAGGASWFGKLIGAKCVGYVESDEYCQKVIRARIRDGIFDDAPIFSDVRTFDGLPYRGRVDLLTAGFPCQPFSCAGKRQGEADERNMWPDTIRIIREVRPGIAMLENVAALATHSYFGTILQDLHAAGYELPRPPSIIGADEVGAPHERLRIYWLAADAESERRRSGRNDKPEEPHHDTERLGKKKSWGGWPLSPDSFRSSYGVANRVNRLRALGNGWVPAVAYEFWQRMMSNNKG